MMMNLLKKVVDDIKDITILPEPSEIPKMERYLNAKESTGKIQIPNIFEATELENEIMESHLRELSFADKK